jgi:hypothetical protein
LDEEGAAAAVVGEGLQQQIQGEGACMKGSSTTPGFPAAVSCSSLRRSQRRRVWFAPATGDRLWCFGLPDQPASGTPRSQQPGLQRCRAPFSEISQQGADGLIRPLLRDPPSGWLRPLLVGRPHPKRRMGRWGAQTIISAALAPSSRRHRFQRLSPEVLEALAFCSSHPRVAEQAAQALFKIQMAAPGWPLDPEIMALLHY